MQHEREPLGRAQRVEHDLQRDPDRVRQQRFMLGIGPDRGVVDDRLGPQPVERLLTAAPAEPQHVEADSGDDRGQPALEAVDLLGVAALQP